jgi:hypothetical protein
MCLRGSCAILCVWLSLFLHPSGVLAAGTGDGQPSCDALKSWVETANTDATFEPFPKVTMSRAFEDDAFVPVFGSPVGSMTRDDFNALNGQLFECRKQAGSDGDKAALATFSTAMTIVKKASRAMKTVWTAKTVAGRQVESLLQNARDQNYAPVLAIAEKSLRGEDVASDLDALERRWQGHGRQAAELSGQIPYLTDAEIDEYVAQLREKKETFLAESEAEDKELAGLLEKIAAAPVSEAGLGYLRRLHHQTDTSSMSRENLQAYNQAFQARWQFINSQLKRAEDQKKRTLATSPAPIAAALNRVVDGALGGSMTVAGTKPGLALNQAVSALTRRTGYKEALSFEDGTQFTVTGNELKRHTEQEGRDGGLVNLQTQKGIAGEVEYIEHFTGPLDAGAARKAAIDRFGAPSKEDRVGPFQRMMWADGEYRLTMIVGPRINGVARFQGNWRSSLQIVLQSEAFVDYLAEAAARCERLRDKPADELSVNDKQAILTRCLTP